MVKYHLKGMKGRRTLPRFEDEPQMINQNKVLGSKNNFIPACPWDK